MSIIKSIKQVLGLSGTASENHFFDGSVPNQLSLKRGTPDAPGAVVMQIVNAEASFPAGSPQLPIANIVFSGLTAGTVPPSIGFGITSRTKNSTGLFSLTFTVPLADTNYVVQITAYNSNTGIIGTVVSGTTSVVNLAFYDAAGALADPGQVNVTIWSV